VIHCSQAATAFVHAGTCEPSVRADIAAHAVTAVIEMKMRPRIEYKWREGESNVMASLAL
jgi:hypothetical protein